jgi:TPR repeat protein
MRNRTNRTDPIMRLTRLSYMWALLAVASPALAIDSRENVERAVALIESGQHELARSYLEPALIDFRLNAGERSRAYYLRGYSFFDQGMYVSASKDYNRALEFHPGNPVVLSAVAQMHLEGLGVEQDAVLGAALLEQAAEAKHPPAALRLGIAYLRGMGVEQDVDVARQWLTEAAEAELAPAMLYLGQSYRAPFADPGDPELAREWFQKAEQAGASDALAYLGFMAEAGEGGEADPEAARDYFQRAADAGSAVAQAKIGHMYLTGDGVDADPSRALALFRKAADQGHPTGYMGLAYLYDSGTAVQQDQAEAHVWYERAAAAGVPEAQLRLAYIGITRGDLPGQRQAGKWLSEAAAQNNVQALNDYAWLLATSPFAEVRNGQQAVTLALQAVDRSRIPAYLDTLAAAYAETGKFDRAVETQREALTLVKDGETELVAELKSHLEAFEDGQPWRE